VEEVSTQEGGGGVRIFEGIFVRLRSVSQALAWVFCASACHIAGTCKVGDDEGCPEGTYCQGKKGAKAGDDGVCTKSRAPGSVGFSLSGFAPLEAKFGEVLRIQGENFSTLPSENSVTLGKVEVPAAHILSATPTQLEVKVPKDMRCTGLIQVTVGERTATSTTAFTYMPTATVSTLAGGTPGTGQTSTQFHSLGDLSVDTQGTLYVVDTGNYCIHVVTPAGDISVFAGGSGSAFLDHAERSNARFMWPLGISIDAQTFYVTDAGNSNRIRKVTEGVSTLAGAGTANLQNGMGADAHFNAPDGITIDLEGTLYVADSGNNCIRKVRPDGLVSTFVGNGTPGFADGTADIARFSHPGGVAIDDRTGTLYVADTGNNRIRKVTPEGVVTTLAGSGAADFLDGPRAQAGFNSPRGMVVDKRNDCLYVADGNNNRIRMVTPNGVVSTLAGGGVSGGYIDAIGDNARFHFPLGIAMDAQGTLYVTDKNNHRIRKITLE